MNTASADLSRREMYAEIHKLCAANSFTNWRILLQEYATYAVLVAICLATYHWIKPPGPWIETPGWSKWSILPVYLLTVLAIGLWTQNRLSCLVHEASHFLLFKNRLLNDVAANLLVCFPFFAKISNYRAGHWGHHRHVNDPENDPDLKRLGKHQAREFPVSKLRFLWEYLFLQMLPHKAYSYLKGRAEYIAFVKGPKLKSEKNQPLKQPWMFLLRAGYYLTLVVVLTRFEWWPTIFCSGSYRWSLFTRPHFLFERLPITATTPTTAITQTVVFTKVIGLSARSFSPSANGIMYCITCFQPYRIIVFGELIKR